MLLFFTLLIAICGLLYELLLWTLSSYLIWDSVTQFSFTIGFFMSGMWIGAYLSRFLEKNAVYNFLKVELLLSVIWASSVVLLKMLYLYIWEYGMLFQFFYFLITMTLGACVWIEIPLVASIYKKLKIKSVSIVSDIFTFDYIWGLFASLLFPLLFLPLFGLYHTAIFVWCINLLVAIWYIAYLKKNFKKYNCSWKKYYVIIAIIALYFFTLLTFANKIENFYLKFYFKQPILETHQTLYQNITLTKKWEDLRMYLNWNIQFNSLDENRYHEALVDWPLKLYFQHNQTTPKKVLVLGWWDWLAVRNLLKYEWIEEITLVELDPKMILISRTQSDLVSLNEWSLSSEKLKIITTDAFKYLETNTKKYDVIIADFPDPRDVFTSKLYSQEFYIMAQGSLDIWWIYITQSSSSYFATKAFWSIYKTMNHVFWDSIAYHRYLPSFWDWWFVVSQPKTKELVIENLGKLNNEYKTFENFHKKNIQAESTLCPDLWCTWFDQEYERNFTDVEVNSLTQPHIIEYYLEWYKKFNL